MTVFCADCAVGRGTSAGIRFSGDSRAQPAGHRFIDWLQEEGSVEDTFGISEESSSGNTVLSVAGELDIATAPELRDRFEEAIDRVPQGTVVVDLLKVTFIDSTALGVLIGGLKRSQTAGGEFRIVVAEPRILKIFEITGLTDLFSIFDTLAGATAG